MSEELSARYCKTCKCIMPLTDGKCDYCLNHRKAEAKQDYKSPIFTYNLSDHEMSALLSVMKDWLDERDNLKTDLSKDAWHRVDKIYMRLRAEFYGNFIPMTVGNDGVNEL